MLTMVYPYNERSLQYVKCQRYRHAMKRYGAKDYTCRKCAEQHPTCKCNSQRMKCANCGEGHGAGRRECRERRAEETLILTQKTTRVGRKKTREIRMGEAEKGIKEETFVGFVKLVVDIRERRKM